MSRRSRDLSRRGFLASAVAVGAVAAGPTSAVADQAAVASSAPQPTLAIDALGLDAATRADLEAFAHPVLREAAWLAELPLGDIAPAFRFAPEDVER